MKLVLLTQYRENYGYRWKNRGGWKYFVEIDTELSRDDIHIQRMLEMAKSAVEYKNDMAEEYVIDWYFSHIEQIGEFDESLEITLETKH